MYVCTIAYDKSLAGLRKDLISSESIMALYVLDIGTLFLPN